MNISKKGINRLIFRAIIEMIIVFIILIASYIIFNTNNLYSYASYIEENENREYNVEVNYFQSKENLSDILYSRNLLDKGELSIKNPNKISKTIKLYILIDDESNINLNGMSIDIQGKTINCDNLQKIDEKYVLFIGELTLDKHENRNMIISILGDPFVNQKINYSFMVENS